MTISPSDERGLSHLSLDSRLRGAFLQLPPAQVAELAKKVKELSK